jgi:ribonuclease P protein component
LDIRVAPAATGTGRVGYVIARKSMPLAVDRNRLRRRLRAAWQRLEAEVARYDIVIRVRRSVTRSEIDAAVAEGDEALRALARETPS